LGQGGVYEKDGKFLTGVTGAMWPRPESDDFTRAGLAGLNWTRLSWSNVDCCQKVNKVKQWEDVRTGVPDCFCRDVLMQSEYKTSSFCMLQQACENALRDFNKVFGEGYMVNGRGDEWDTESPLRSCMHSSGSRWYVEPCGRKSSGSSWTDPFGRQTTPVQDYLPSKTYGKVIVKADVNDVHKWHWVPGDLPIIKRNWHGKMAGDFKVEPGILAGSDVYPGTDYPACCREENGADSDCCKNSKMMQWKSPQNAVQADCMFAVKRALCAYHFWECDASYPGVLEISLSPALNPFYSSFPSNDENSHAEDAIYNSVCQDTCTDIGKLCGVVPSTGRALQLSSFTIGKYHYLGCSSNTRKYVKDCTSQAMSLKGSFTSFICLSSFLSLVLWYTVKE